MKIVVPEITERTRLDVFVTSTLANVSRSFIEKLGEQSKLIVNDEVKPSRYKVKPGDVIHIDYDFDVAKLVPAIDLPILYEDDDCIVVNKPSGILTHSKGAFNPEATVATFIADKISGFSASDDRAGIVHRLDRATSGVILCAKHPSAMQWFQKQFSSRKVKKTYFAIISGEIEPKQAVIKVPIGRNPRNPKMFYATLHGKPATTEYKVIEESAKYSLLELKPETGRTHQLRVHLQYLKHPIVGDTFYGGDVAERLFLHAERLEITLPSSKRQVFTAELPPQFNEKLHES